MKHSLRNRIVWRVSTGEVVSYLTEFCLYFAARLKYLSVTHFHYSQSRRGGFHSLSARRESSCSTSLLLRIPTWRMREPALSDKEREK